VAVLEAHAAVGGGVLAAGLAFGAVFAAIPTILLALGLAGLFVADPAVRAGVALELARRIPPLEGMAGPVLDRLAAEAGGVSLLGLATLAWSAGRFYGQLDAAFALVFGGPGRRGFLDRTARGLVAVGLLAASYLVVAWASLLAAGLPGGLAEARDLILGPAGPAVVLALVMAAVALVYRTVPRRRMTWRAIALPALVVAAGEGLLASAYVLLAPLLAAPAVFGPLATAFAALAWLSWAFQLLLVGGSWVRLRSDRVPGGDAGGSGLAGAAPAAEAGRRGEGQPAADAGLDA